MTSGSHATYFIHLSNFSHFTILCTSEYLIYGYVWCLRISWVKIRAKGNSEKGLWITHHQLWKTRFVKKTTYHITYACIPLIPCKKIFYVLITQLYYIVPLLKLNNIFITLYIHNHQLYINIYITSKSTSKVHWSLGQQWWIWVTH